jgi:hypothetical protein
MSPRHGMFVMSKTVCNVVKLLVTNLALLRYDIADDWLICGGLTKYRLVLFFAISDSFPQSLSISSGSETEVNLSSQIIYQQIFKSKIL